MFGKANREETPIVTETGSKDGDDETTSKKTDKDEKTSKQDDKGSTSSSKSDKDASSGKIKRPDNKNSSGNKSGNSSSGGQSQSQRTNGSGGGTTGGSSTGGSQSGGNSGGSTGGGSSNSTSGGSNNSTGGETDDGGSDVTPAYPSSSPVYGNGSAEALAHANSAQRRLVQAAKDTPATPSGYSASWVENVYENAGFGHFQGNSCDLYDMYCPSSDLSRLKVGMIMAVSTHPHTTDGRRWGHSAIYIGDNLVMDCVNGNVRTLSLDEWIDYYGVSVPVRWGWLGNVNVV